MSFLSRLFGKKQEEAALIPSSESPAELTSNHRAEAFWKWFETVAERFYQTIEDEQSPALAGEMSAAVDRLLPGAAWVFGPGENRIGHSLTLSGEGILPKQILAEEWLKRAPKIQGWTFYAGRQPSESSRDFSIEFGELTFKAIEFWVTPEIDEEEEKFDLYVWHPLADGENTRHFQMALFLFLDEIFGEYGTGRWIGALNVSKDKLAKSIPIGELKEFVDDLVKERGWKMRTPFEVWSQYSVPKDRIGPNRPRLDTIAGTCLCFEPIGDFLKNPSAAEDPFAPFGADWIFLSFGSSFFGDRNPVDVRHDISELIEERLEGSGSGLYLGGAIGVQRGYIDFLIFDGPGSVGIIREAARTAGLPEDTRIEYLSGRKRHLGRRLF